MGPARRPVTLADHGGGLPGHELAGTRALGGPSRSGAAERLAGAKRSPPAPCRSRRRRRMRHQAPVYKHGRALSTGTGLGGRRRQRFVKVQVTRGASRHKRTNRGLRRSEPSRTGRCALSLRECARPPRGPGGFLNCVPGVRVTPGAPFNPDGWLVRAIRVASEPT